MKDFTAIANDIIDAGNLDPYQGWILVRIARRGVCFESQRSMAEGTNISLAHVNRTIKWLHENGYIERKKDERYGRVGWSVVIPEEQIQQNSVIPQEQDVIPQEQDVIPQERLVIPQERHLNKTNIKRLNKKINEEKQDSPQPPIDTFPFVPVANNSKSPMGAADKRVSAILAVCGLDPTVPAHLNQAEQAAAQLSSYSADAILDRYEHTKNPNGSWYWYRDDFRGERGDMPSVKNVVDTIGKRRLTGQGQRQSATGKKTTAAESYREVFGE